MSNIRCPHCGKWQEAYPHILICGNCYADISDVVEKHFGKQAEKGTAKARESSEQTSWITFPAARTPESMLLKKVWSAARSRTAKEAPGLSSIGVILKRTMEIFFKRFWPLYPLSYLSFSFLMFIGIFVSMVGLQVLFPEQYSLEPLMLPVFAVGAAACLFVSIYAQAAFMFAVTNRELTFGDALTGGWQRLGPYLLLVVLIVASVGVGSAMFLIPGVIAGLLFLLAPFILVRENVGPVAALSRSARYFSGAWLRLSIRLSPVAIIAIFTWLLFGYAGVPILVAVKDEIAFVFIVSLLINVPIVLIAAFVFTVYDDLREAEGLPVSGTDVVQPQAQEAPTETAPAAPGLSSHAELMSRAWALFRRRFAPLTVLNLLSYAPHVLYLALLFVPLFGLRMFSANLQEFGGYGGYGFLFFLGLLPPRILILLAVGAVVCLILLVFAQIFGVALYLLLELAYVNAIVDERIGAWEAIKRARKRLRGFFWAQFYRNFVVGTGWMLVVPGVAFWVWYQFTPYVFALQRGEETPLSSLQESRELVRGVWGAVFRELLSLRILPVLLVVILVGFIFAGLPFYWIFGSLLFTITGHHPPAMFAIYSPYFWTMLYVSGLVLFAGFYLPFQKVVLYILYRELKEAKSA